MAIQTIVADIGEGLNTTLFRLAITQAGQPAPDPAGYIPSLSASEDGKYSITTNGLTGIYRVTAENGDGVTVAQGYTQSLVDTASTFWCDASYVICYLDEQARTRVDAALAAYDAPTKAELDASQAAIEADISGLNDLSAAGIRAAIGLASANLDTQLSTIDTVVDANRALLEADVILVESSGVYKLHLYAKGTSTDLVTAKTAKQPDGADLTDPNTERIAGYQQ